MARAKAEHAFVMMEANEVLELAKLAASDLGLHASAGTSHSTRFTKGGVALGNAKDWVTLDVSVELRDTGWVLTAECHKFGVGPIANGNVKEKLRVFMERLTFHSAQVSHSIMRPEFTPGGGGTTV
jgi:hypothetical protein